MVMSPETVERVAFTTFEVPMTLITIWRIIVTARARDRMEMRHWSMVALIGQSSVNAFTLSFIDSSRGLALYMLLPSTAWTPAWAISTAAGFASIGLVLRVFVSTHARFHPPTMRIRRMLDIVTAISCVALMLVWALPAKLQSSFVGIFSGLFLVVIATGLSVYSITTLASIVKTAPLGSPLQQSTESLLRAIRMLQYIFAIAAIFILIGQILPAIAKRSAEDLRVYTQPLLWILSCVGQIIM